MQETITVHLPSEVMLALDDATRKEGVSPDELVGQAVKQYLAIRRFRLLRQRMTPNAESQGVYTDDDAFGRVCPT